MKYLIICAVLIFISCKQPNGSFFNKPVKLQDGIQTATLRDVGINETLIKAMEDSIEKGVYPNIHSVLIFRNNHLVYEKYWAGPDENRRTNSKGILKHHRDSFHDIRSISKSITSAAVMLAFQQGKIESLDQKIFYFFPEFLDYAMGDKKEITIRHLLTMTSGLHWQESYNDSMKIKNISYALDFILRQPLVETPGSRFSYNSASTQLLAQIVEKATGENIEVFTHKYLFTPLEITDFDWTKEKNGLISAWAGLRMRSRDLLKFGILYLDKGRFNDKQIISSKLIEESMQAHIYTEEPYGYGYQFWTYPEGRWGLRGIFGQSVTSVPDKNAVVVFLSNWDKASDRELNLKQRAFAEKLVAGL